MPTRTTRSTITFTAAFRLAAVGETLPPGRYDVDTDEEEIVGNNRTVYRRTATLLYVPTRSGLRVCTVDPADLDAALAADRRPGSDQA
ncbi:MAG: hypothetical protein ACRCSO_06545 [Sphingomonas sp.]